MAKEQQPWRDMDGDPESPFLERRFQHAGMEEVDPKHVLAWDEESGNPIFAMNPDGQRISWDPRYIDSEEVKKWLKLTYKQIDREMTRKNKGFG